MAKTNFQYDETGNTFYYFFLTFLGAILIPSTYYFWPQVENKYTLCNEDIVQGLGGPQNAALFNINFCHNVK